MGYVTSADGDRFWLTDEDHTGPTLDQKILEFAGGYLNPKYDSFRENNDGGASNSLDRAVRPDPLGRPGWIAYFAGAPGATVARPSVFGTLTPGAGDTLGETLLVQSPEDQAKQLALADATRGGGPGAYLLSMALAAVGAAWAAPSIAGGASVVVDLAPDYIALGLEGVGAPGSAVAAGLTAPAFAPVLELPAVVDYIAQGIEGVGAPGSAVSAGLEAPAFTPIAAEVPTVSDIANAVRSVPTPPDYVAQGLEGVGEPGSAVKAGLAAPDFTPALTVAGGGIAASTVVDALGTAAKKVITSVAGTVAAAVAAVSKPTTGGGRDVADGRQVVVGAPLRPLGSTVGPGVTAGPLAPAGVGSMVVGLLAVGALVFLNR